MKHNGEGFITDSRRNRSQATRLLWALPLTLAAAFLLLPASQALALPPLASGIATSQVHATSARLEALVNPEGKATAYQFEYLRQAQWEEEGESFAAAAKAPPSPAGIGSGTTGISVAEKVASLQPATAYRFRVVAESQEGTSEAAGTFTTYGLPQPFGPCPNESLRYGAGADLPDCRAYEQASPVDKNGGNVGGSVSVIKASLSGDGITFESQVGVPGGDGSQTFPLYMASREGDGWVTRGLLPPGTENEVGAVLGWTPDFARVFDNAGQDILGGRALLARPRQGNPLTEIVPYTSPEPGYFLVGFSADGSKVLFWAKGALPVKAGDPLPTLEGNIYAWDRESEELSLAGVLPDGSAPPEGTSVIGGNAQDEHVVAEDGSVFFYDKETGLLYLRLHPTAKETEAKDGKGNCVPDPVLACTLAVSVSHKTVPDPAGPFKPTFRAASADGSITFFTSPEELTEDAHTIAPANVIGRADISGPEPDDVEGDFASGPNVSAMAASATHLYWIDTATGTIARSNLDGEEIELECITATNEPKGIAIGVGADSGHLYWTNKGSATIGRANIDGSCAEAQSSANQSFITGLSNPLGLDTGGAYLYWANFGPKSIGRARLNGSGAASEVEPEWFSDTPRTRGIDVAADTANGYLFIARGFGTPVARVDLEDPPSEELGLPGEAKNAQQIAVDGNRIYWTYAITEAGATENIACSDLNGENANTGCIPVQHPSGIAIGVGADSGHLYWGDHPSGRGADLYRFDAASDELVAVAVAEKAIRGAEVQGLLGASADGTYAYFVANGSFDGAPAGNCNGSSGSCNLYLWHEEEGHSPITFLARLEDGDKGDWATNPAKSARVTPDGRTVLFGSARQLTAYDNTGPCAFGGAQGPCFELYRYRVGDPEPTCLSCDPSGAPPRGSAALGSIGPATSLGLNATVQTSLLSRNLSPDGNRVFFETADPLVAADTNGDEGCSGSVRTCQDVYEWEAKGTGSCTSEAQNGGCLYLLSTGKSGQASFFADADPSGDNAFILTASRLVGQDEDGLLDFYDARAGGGLASQAKEEEPSCEGSVACRSQLPPPPATQVPGSAGFSGEGNQTPKRPHRKKKHKHKRAKHKQQHRKAKQSRGAGR